VLSRDGALTTTLDGILAQRELQPTALEATAFALGIHEDTGSLTYPSTTQRDIDALAWCARHGARQELIGAYLHVPLQDEERDLLQHLLGLRLVLQDTKADAQKLRGSIAVDKIQRRTVAARHPRKGGGELAAGCICVHCFDSLRAPGRVPAVT